MLHCYCLCKYTMGWTTYTNYCWQETPENLEGDPDAPTSTAEGDIRTVYRD